MLGHTLRLTATSTNSLPSNGASQNVVSIPNIIWRVISIYITTSDWFLPPAVLRTATQIGLLRCCQHQLRRQSTDAQTEQPRSRSLDAIRDRLDAGPSFQDFVQAPDQAAAAAEWHGYEGKLRRDKGDNERLRLPPWLKTQIPMGQNFAKIKKQLRELKLATVCEEAKCPNIGECWGGGEHGTQTATIMVSCVSLVGVWMSVGLVILSACGVRGQYVMCSMKLCQVIA